MPAQHPTSSPAPVAAPAVVQEPARSSNWLQSLAPLALAATLVLVGWQLSLDWSGAPEPVPQQPADHRQQLQLLAERTTQDLKKAKDCVQQRWPAENLVAGCRDQAPVLEQVFVVSIDGGEVKAARPLMASGATTLGSYVGAENDAWRRAVFSGTEGFAFASAFDAAAAAPAGAGTVFDRFVTLPKQSGGGSVLVLRHRLKGLALAGSLQTEGQEGQAQWQLGVHQGPSAVSGAAAEGVSVLSDGVRTLRLFAPGSDVASTAATTPGPSNRLGELFPWQRWSGVVAVCLLLLALVALWFDRQRRAREQLALKREQALRAQLNQELKKSEELVAQLSKLENGLMQVALASERLHNWKKLISTVDNCLKKLTTALASQPDSSQLAGLARTATRASAAASEMASEISSSDWEQAPTLSATSVADLVEDAWMRVSKGSDVSQIYRPLTIRPNLPKVQVERGLLMLALASLMDNAVRAVKQRDAWVQTGKVHVSAELNPEDRNTLWLSIEDNGPGLPEHVVRMFGKIVEPGTPGGHGNGIALARLSIARSGGVITPFERRTGGTEIRVSLLVAPAAGESNQLDSLQNED